MGDVVPKSLTFRDLDVVLKGPFRYVHLFLFLKLFSNIKKSKIKRNAVFSPTGCIVLEIENR